MVPLFAGGGMEKSEVIEWAAFVFVVFVIILAIVKTTNEHLLRIFY